MCVCKRPVVSLTNFAAAEPSNTPQAKRRWFAPSVARCGQEAGGRRVGQGCKWLVGCVPSGTCPGPSASRCAGFVAANAKKSPHIHSPHAACPCAISPGVRRLPCGVCLRAGASWGRGSSFESCSAAAALGSSCSHPVWLLSTATRSAVTHCTAVVWPLISQPLPLPALTVTFADNSAQGPALPLMRTRRTHASVPCLHPPARRAPTTAPTPSPGPPAPPVGREGGQRGWGAIITPPPTPTAASERDSTTTSQLQSKND